MDSKKTDLLNKDQFEIFEKIMESLRKKQGQMFFVEGPAGTGKSFLLNAIQDEAKRLEYSVTASASTAVAAVLLGGVTAHSTFGIEEKRPEPPYKSSVWKGTHRAEDLKLTDLFIWDDISMSEDCHLITADTLLRQLTAIDRPFGGKVVVFAGDKKGLPPPDTNPEERAFAWEDWSLVQQFSLTENMRVNPAESEYAALLLNIRESSPSDVPPELGSRIVDSLDELIAETFSGCFDVESPSDTFGRIILTLRIEESHQLNDKLLEMIHKDKPVVHEYSVHPTYPNIKDDLSKLESLHAHPGCPLHKLALKIGADIMLLENGEIGDGERNGTVLTVNGITGSTLTGIIKNGPFANHPANIRRKGAPYKLGHGAEMPTTNRVKWVQRKQFPVCLRYASTIHKAQGQTFDKVGVYVKGSAFAQGQLYTALSRVRSINDVFIFLSP